MFLNIRGLIAKQSDLSHLLYHSLGQHKIDIVILAETWHTKGNVNRIKLPGSMVKLECTTRSPLTLYRAVFLFLCALNVVLIFYYIFINVQLLWLLHSIGPLP